MNQINADFAIVEEQTSEAVASTQAEAVTELSEAQLLLVGGGTGAIAF